MMSREGWVHTIPTQTEQLSLPHPLALYAPVGHQVLRVDASAVVNDELAKTCLSCPPPTKKQELARSHGPNDSHGSHAGTLTPAYSCGILEKLVVLDVDHVARCRTKFKYRTGATDRPAGNATSGFSDEAMVKYWRIGVRDQGQLSLQQNGLPLSPNSKQKVGEAIAQWIEQRLLSGLLGGLCYDAWLFSGGES